MHPVGSAKELGMEEIPVIRIEYLSGAEKRAYILAENKLAEKAGWANVPFDPL